MDKYKSVDACNDFEVSTEKGNGDPLTFFRDVYRAFNQAEKSEEGTIDRHYSIGGYSIRLRFAGPALVPYITPALEHLESDSCETPKLTICLWDSASTSVKIPPPPWTQDDYIARDEIRGYNDGRIHAAFQIEAGILSLLDVEQNLAICWVRDAQNVPYYETGAPLLRILHWWMLKSERQLIHAAAVGIPEKGVLLAGRGGSGKSTTALACINSKLSYVADDYCLVSSEPAPFVYSLYNTAKQAADNMKRFPNHISAVSNPERLETEKALLFLYKHYPGKIAAGFPIRHILIPRITGRHETSLQPAPRPAALKALAPSTIFQLSGADHIAFKMIAGFVRKVSSCYYLDLGTDISKIPNVIHELLKEP